MRLSRDLAFGFANSVFAAFVGFAVVPIYIRLLGTGSYGLIGFFATTQVVIQLFDLGLSATINREAARRVASKSLDTLGSLLHTLSVVYVGTAVVLAAAATLAAPILATRWLQSTTLSIDSIQRAVTLLAVVVACRWPLGLYQGVLLGAHKLASVSVIAMAMTALGSLGAVFVLTYVSTTIEAFFAWQAAVSLLHTLILRRSAWNAVGRGNRRLRFDGSQLRQVWAFTAGVSGIAVIGTLLSQTDKIILSRVLTLEAYGQYMVATVAAGSLQLIVLPAFNVIYPKLSSLFAQSDAALLAYYRRATQLLTALLFPLATVLGVFAHDLIIVWTGNAALAAASAPILQWMLVGTALNGVMYCPYALQLAAGRPRVTLAVLLVLLLVMFPLTVFLSTHFQGLGGAMAWAILNILYLGLGTWLTHRHLLRGNGRRWLGLDVIAPLAASVAVVGSACIALQQSTLPRPAAIAGGLCLAAAFALAQIHLRQRQSALATPPLTS